MIDSWAVPDTAKARSTVAYIVAERVARGLTSVFLISRNWRKTSLILGSIATPLVKTLQSLSTLVPEGQISPINWTEDLIRILHLETMSNLNHQSPVVQAGKKQGIKSTAIELLKAGLSRQITRTPQTSKSSVDEIKIKEDVGAIESLLEAWIHDTDPACNEWNFAMTSIVAQKRFIISEDKEWMSARP